MIQRRANLMTLAVLLAVGPGLLSRAVPGLFTEFLALLLGIAVCMAGAAISLNLLMGYAGQISLGQAALFGVGAFASGLVVTRAGLPLPLGLAAAGAVAGGFAFLLGLPALRLRGLYLAIATIAFGFMMEQSILRWKPVTGGSAGLEIRRTLLGDLALRHNADFLGLTLVVLLIIWIVDRNVLRTKLGRAFHGIREDESVAQSFGVDVARFKLLAFVLSGVIAGVSGGMFGHVVGFVSSESFPYRVSLLLVVMVVVGGLGSRTGVVVAAFFFALLPQVFEIDALRFLKGIDQVIGAALLVFTVARHPGGLAQAFLEAREHRAAKAAQEAPVDEIDEQGQMPKLPSLPRPAGLPVTAGAAASEGVPVLAVEQVSVRFGGLVAVDQASLVVPKGKIVGLIGPNGAGKTTLFNAISGFVRPEGGTMHLLGHEIQSLAPHERVRLGMGRTFQLIGLAKSLPVIENFLLAQHSFAGYGVGAAVGYLRGAARVEADLIERSMHAIRALGFERFVDTPVRNLSHGQQRLVELGCALVTAPELLLLDEPSGGMAPVAVESLAVRLREIRDELGRTVLLIEHNIPLVLDVCDYIYVLNFGRVLAHGPAAEIAAHPEVIAAYFGEAEVEEVPA